MSQRYASPFAYDVEYYVTCAQCPTRISVGRYKHLPYWDTMLPTLPADWIVLEGNAICPKHKVIVNDI